MKKLTRLLADWLPAARYRHSLGVAEVAAELAVKNGVDQQQARLAGLLHDYARDISTDELLYLANEAKLISCEVEIRMPVLLHGPVGAMLIRQHLGITDRQVCQAVARHTVGAPVMEPLDKIIYLADAIEPGRKYNGVEELRLLAAVDLEEAFLQALESSIYFVLARKLPLHPATVEARNNILFTRGVIN